MWLCHLQIGVGGNSRGVVIDAALVDSVRLRQARSYHHVQVVAYLGCHIDRQILDAD